jgi:hypothetical protein
LDLAAAVDGAAGAADTLWEGFGWAAATAGAEGVATVSALASFHCWSVPPRSLD